MAIAPDGSWLATTSRDKTVRIWAVQSQRAVAMTRTEGDLSSCAWGPAGELAVGAKEAVPLSTPRLRHRGRTHRRPVWGLPGFVETGHDFL
ncbi:hypothetical protein [Streptomyces sp. NPDC058677]|uniref:hypothetical protein n=1 Tax=Streptomyces sp. NPDC058677 TaxID=3346594 RepID=UPI00365831F3